MAEKKSTGRRSAASIKGGYERIAFGEINDAVRLILREGPGPEELKRLDLNSIAEIKRTKDGMEIKFYDRMQALECLRKLNESGAKQSPLYRALEKCARSAGKETEDGD